MHREDKISKMGPQKETSIIATVLLVVYVQRLTLENESGSGATFIFSYRFAEPRSRPAQLLLTRGVPLDGRILLQSLTLRYGGYAACTELTRFNQIIQYRTQFRSMGS